MSRKIGLQLWSIKQDLEKDFKAGLKRVAQLGYDGVEFAGYYGIEAPKMKELLQEYGLEVAGVHHNVDELDQNLEAIMAYNRVLENRDIVCAWAPTESYEQVQESIRKLQKAAAVLRENGFRLHYHNHSHDIDGIFPIVLYKLMAVVVVGLERRRGCVRLLGKTPGGYHSGPYQGRHQRGAHRCGRGNCGYPVHSG